MLSEKINGLEVKNYAKSIGAKHIAYGIVYKNSFGELQYQWDDMDNLTHIFYDDKSFDEWVNATLTKFSECDCRDMCIYAVHIN